MILPWTRISHDFDPDLFSKETEVIVIGSGYGGGVAASRLARAGRKVTLLERGREIGPGFYPREMKEGVDEVQVTVGTTGDTFGKQNGLYDLRLGKDMSVLVGCGLGGTSLINANVAVEPEDSIFANWPCGINANNLTPYFQKARKMLGSQPYPAEKTLPKLEALEKAAAGMAKRSDKEITFTRADINVTFQDGLNEANVIQNACNNCGDCVTGCNYRAKNTVLMNYLSDAVGFGATLFTEASVTHISRAGDRWQVHVEGDKPAVLSAEYVILAAGTLGTTEILLRSSNTSQPSHILRPGNPLQFSKRLGQNFSGNGDVWAFGYNANIPSDAINTSDKDAPPAPIYSVGAGTHHPDDGSRFAPGPCITGMIHVKGEKLSDNILIEEGVMPGALAAGYAAAFPMMDALLGDPFRFGDVARRLKDAQNLGNSLKEDPARLPETAYEGPLSRTMPFLVMSHDASDGELVLGEQQKITVDWGNAGLDPAIVGDAKAVKAACDAIQAEYLPLPIWQDAFGNRLITVHPIGGCAIGDSHETGVINHENEVFTANGSLHEGLFVCDGSALPGGVGVNPHLTITAIAERAMDLLIKKKKWPYRDGKAPPRMDVAVPPQVDDINWVETIKTVTKTLEKIQDDFERRPLRCARWRILQAWRRFVIPNYEKYVDPDLQTAFPIADLQTLRRLLKGDALRKIAKPIVADAVKVLQPIRDAIAQKDNAAAFKHVEAAFGDFSPPVSFTENMVGKISQIGLFDSPAPSEAYKVAAKTGVDCTLTATIAADSTKAAISPPDPTAIMRGGTITSDALGGTYSITSGEFHYLKPVPDEVEGWEMRYTGTLEREGEPTRNLSFDAYKIVRRRAGSHWWTDLTELRIDFLENGKPLARGILELSLEDLVEQAQTLTFKYDDGALKDSFGEMYRAFADAPPDTLPTVFNDPIVRRNIVLGFAYALTNGGDRAARALEGAYRLQTLGRMAELTLRNYGGLFSYMADLQKDPKVLAARPADYQTFYPETRDGAKIKLTRYNPGGKGPVILAGGFGTKASSFALPSVNKNLVETLIDVERAGYEVWLFDYRGSGDLEASQTDFNLDHVAKYDWPAAISTVLKESGADSVQAIVHCIGSVTLFMSVLQGETRVRSIISSQIAVHAITNWYKFAQSDAKLAGYIRNGVPPKMRGFVDLLDLPVDMKEAAYNGLKVLDPRSPSQVWEKRPVDPEGFDAALNGLVWNAPDFAPTPCYNPTCHRITFIFGPSYEHNNLNQATHLRIGDLFGPVSSTPFAHISRIFRTGHVVNAKGEDVYRPNVGNLNMPIHFIAGAANQEMLPEATLRTQRWLQLQDGLDAKNYTRHVFQGYGHMDCFIGKQASCHIFPHLLAELQKHT